MNRFRDLMSFCWLSALLLANSNAAIGQAIRAGVAKVDITNTQAGPVNDPLYAKAIVIASADTTMVLVSVDAVAIGEIDVRHAYSLPPDDQVAGIGPVAPKIGVVRFDRLDGSPMAFA